jgi:hypothetical protein
LDWREGHGSFLAGIIRGAFHAGDLSAEDDPSAEELKYTSGFVIEHNGERICEVVKQLGQGAMGTVYLVRRPDGSQVALKTVREDTSAPARRSVEEKLAVEVSIGFAMGRCVLIASVVGVVVPLPGEPTTAKGLVLLCDLVDGSDLEEAMSTVEAVRIFKPDYKGNGLGRAGDVAARICGGSDLPRFLSRA